ncbi:uncharacterized protein LOC126733740 [Anthonomus grandis grandis]|uniref:uncharacterized protein LOC126733740 n=1 Tax=Anthonomus grandis grandis TaxID=2921223 RepID=UPI00216654AB|nr:uncharacterized protein LOC126733740 [Anthonomus grandis grandis]
MFHGHNKENINESCQTCKNWINHKTGVNESRQLYKEHSDKTFNQDTICVSADLQKVVMLPQMDMFKCVIFLQRLIAYNETFVPVTGKFSSKNKPYAVIWHETISKRSKEDLISTFYSFIKSNRDAKTIIIWLDNCASQNKNWALLTFLVRMINSDEISATTICFNYFEPGHTFMSADSFHHQVELSMKRKQKIYDFDDFADAVGSCCNGKVDVKKMDIQDFFQWKDFLSRQKLNDHTQKRPYLSDIVQITAERGKFTLKYKTSFSGEDKVLDFLQKKIMKKSQLVKNFACLDAPRGFPNNKKENVLKVLDKIIPENRKMFWLSLPSLSEPNEEDP